VDAVDARWTQGKPRASARSAFFTDAQTSAEFDAVLDGEPAE